MSRLRECPFCGHKASITYHDHDSKRWYGVTCKKTLCGGRTPESYEQQADAYKAWNTRHEHPVVAALFEAAEKIRHWHDVMPDGMIVSAKSVRGLWEALGNYRKFKEKS